MNSSELRNKINIEISNRQNSRNFYDVLLTKTLKAKLKHLDEIEEILGYEKYKIVFIGRVGAGKTTAICHLFNLLTTTDKNDNTSSPLFSQDVKGKEELDISEILKTGNGYTTLCEVELLLSDESSRIKIDPYTDDDIMETLSSFAEFIHNKVSPDKDNPNSPGKQIISTELDRAIKNITNLNTVTQDSKKIDQCKVEFLRCGSVESFRDFLIERANLSERIVTEVGFTPEHGDEKLWLKKTFEEINGGRLSKFLLPKKIYVYLSKNIIKESLFDNFETIIDTKGLDVNENREDIDDYIKDRRAICIFTTEFKDAPDVSTRNLLEYHFKDKLAKNETKVVILVLPHKGMAEGEEGAEDREDGILIRRGIIQDNLANCGITEIEDSHIPFFDALRYYTKENNKISFNPQNTRLVENDRDEIVLNLLTTIEDRKAFYKAEFEQLVSDVNQIIGGSLSSEDEQLISETYNKIINFSNLNFYSYKELTDRFVNYFKSNYAPMTIKAINRRFGFYDVRGINIFYDAKKMSAETILRMVTKDYSEKVLTILSDLRNQVNNEDVAKLIDEIKTQFHYLYKTFIDDISSEIYDFLHDQKLSEDEKYDFWEDVIDMRGKDYRERVGATYRDELEKVGDGFPNTNEYFKKLTETHWKESVIAGIANYFER
jgi:GTPase SAR1 family protein